jgi:pSer/pThr/pTyr-binding forkhead associated (FHA) protein
MESRPIERTIPGAPHEDSIAEPKERPDVPPVLVVEVFGGPMDGLRRRVDGTSMSVGRSPENDLVLAKDRMVSSRHARIVRDGDRTWLEDLGSLNGSFVGMDRVDGRVPLHRGSIVTLGRTRLEFLSL